MSAVTKNVSAAAATKAALWDPLRNMDPTKWAVSTRGERGEMLEHYNARRAAWRADPRYRNSLAQHLIEDIHDGFRNYCNSLVQSYMVSKKVPMSGFETLLRSLEGHHRYEDASFFPNHARRFPETRPAYAFLAKDHKHLHPLEMEVRQGSGEALLEFTSFLVDHLNREELLTVPYMLDGKW